MSDTPTPVARSPIRPTAPTIRDGWEIDARRATGEPTLSDETPLTKIAIRAPFDGAVRRELGVGFGRTHRDGDTLVVGAGPGEWLVLAAPGRGPELVTTLGERLNGTGELVTVIDLTHGRALVRLEGRSAPKVLAKVCGIDFADAVTPDGTALRTSVARVVTDVVRDDSGGGDGTPSYLLHVERSSGQYLADVLRDAGLEFGLETTTLRGAGWAA